MFVAKAVTECLKKFWTYISCENNPQSKIPTLKSHRTVTKEVKLATSDLDKANLLSPSSQVLTILPPDTTVSNCSSTVSITLDILAARIPRISASKSPGSDGIHPRIISYRTDWRKFPATISYL
jgi:hypothetical protein